MKYIFNTKFVPYMDRNGQEIEIIRNTGKGMVLVKFVKDNRLMEIYDSEIKECEE